MADGARLIIVEDDVDLRRMLEDYLGGAGHRVRAAGDGVGLRRLLDAAPADLVVLDLGLPGEDGLSLARWLREHHDLGIVMLTAADTSLDRILGLEVGADDYVGKPFAPRELQARIEAVLRRRRPVDGGPPLPNGALRFGRFVLYADPLRLLDADGVDQGLSLMELELIQAFAANAGRALSRDRLLDLAPPRGDEPFDRSIDNRITRLRKKLERDPGKPELIKTIRGAGYLYPG
jgi:DNA-binding response OmpR family regulator